MAQHAVLNSVKTNESFQFYVALEDAADDEIFALNPVLAAGDVLVSTDGGATANAATLPTVVPAGGRNIQVDLSASEMNGSDVVVTFEDQTATADWLPLIVTIHTKAVDLDDLVRSTTPANTLDVEVGGGAGLDWGNVANKTTTHDFTNTTINIVTTLTGHTVQTGDSFARLAAPAGASVSADIAAMKTDTAAILVDSNELQGDWVNGGRLDLLLDAVVADVASLDDTKIPDTLSLANINAEVDTALNTAIPGAPVADSINQRVRTMDLLTEASGGGDLAAILGDTNELQADWANGGRLDLLLDAVLADTGTTGCRIDLTQTYTEGQTARTIGGALEVTEATERNRIALVAGVRTLYRNDATTTLVTRTQTSTTLG